MNLLSQTSTFVALKFCQFFCQNGPCEPTLFVIRKQIKTGMTFREKALESLQMPNLLRSLESLESLEMLNSDV